MPHVTNEMNNFDTRVGHRNRISNDHILTTKHKNWLLNVINNDESNFLSFYFIKKSLLDDKQKSRSLLFLQCSSLLRIGGHVYKLRREDN